MTDEQRAALTGVLIVLCLLQLVVWLSINSGVFE